MNTEIAKIQDWLRSISKEDRIEFARIVGRESRGKHIEAAMIAVYKEMKHDGC